MGVSMPSRAYTSFLREMAAYFEVVEGSSVNALSGLYLISTTSMAIWSNLFSIVSMPSRAYTSFLRICWYARKCTTICVSMPSRAYTSFLRYPFKNLGFMRFPEPVFAGIYQNILTTAVFRAC